MEVCRLCVCIYGERAAHIIQTRIEQNKMNEKETNARNVATNA